MSRSLVACPEDLYSFTLVLLRFLFQLRFSLQSLVIRVPAAMLRVFPR